MGGNSSDKPDHCLYLSKDADDEDLYKITSSLFLGPQAENMDHFKENISIILDRHTKARTDYNSKDGVFITEGIRESSVFEGNTNKIRNAVLLAGECLAKASVPFWSPRYAAHMTFEANMPALLGYFMTMLYNPNNVSIEASPLTTIAEIKVGLQLCKLFGYNKPPDKAKDRDPNGVYGWGHIVSCGSIANLESMWSARAVKFYPLALKNAINDDGPLSFIGDSFKVETCVGIPKLVKTLSTWELLNLKVPTVLGIPQKLYDEHGISPGYLENVMATYSIQSTGQGILEQRYGIDKPIQFMAAGTRHYSWPKGGAILGIGSDNVVSIDVDDGARIDIKDLKRRLYASLKEKQAVFSVVAVIGTTEEGGVDPLKKIVDLRDKFQAKGLSFMIHADAAWGGYFASMLPSDYKQPARSPRTSPPGDEREGFVPLDTLRAETQEHLHAIRYADSVTVDPHKAGYVPYPAGGLCYRDERQKYLITWTSPYITRSDETINIGIFGVEGSKPGAAAMSTFFSNSIIGMDSKGYGSLLGQVSFTCSRFSAHWASMHTEEDDFILKPFNLIPSEQEGLSPEKVEEQRQMIRDRIIGKSNTELVKDGEAMHLLQEIGSDLNINAIALNFRLSNGYLNKDVEEANRLNRRVVERFTINSPKDDPTTKEFFLSSTEFTHRLYGRCAQNYKRRLELDEKDETELFVLRNVVMSPWPTDHNFVDIMAGVFKSVVSEEVDAARKRNEIGPANHSFIIHGTDKIFLVHRPNFHFANHRRQLILSAELDGEAKKQYIEEQNSRPEETFILEIRNEALENIVTGSKVNGCIETIGGCTIEAEVRTTGTVKDRALNSRYRDSTYPSYRMPFYLYGTSSQQHIDHVLTRHPNISLSAPSITLKIKPSLSADILSRGCILFAEGIHEASMQPFPLTSDVLERDDFFFRPGASFPVTVYRDTKDPNENGPGLVDVLDQDLVGKGEVVLGPSVHLDSELVNREDSELVNRDFARKIRYKEWEDEFDCIRKALQGK